MRKVTKVLLIGALVVAIAGILCIAGGFAAGASTQLRKSGTMASWMKFLPGSMFGEKDTSSANRSTEDGTFTTDSYLSKSQAVDLNIDVKVADIEIQTASDVSKDSEHGTVLVQIQYDTEVQRFDIVEKDGILKISETGSARKIQEVSDSAKIVVQIADSAKIGSVQISTGVGDISMNTEDTFSSGSFFAETGTGDVTFRNLTCTGDAQMQSGVGDLDVEGTFQGNVTMKSGTGDLKLDVTGNQDDFSYDLTSVVGDIVMNHAEVGGESVSGSYKVKNQGAAQKIEMNAGVGDINVSVH